jgi:hypothetical protein
MHESPCGVIAEGHRARLMAPLAWLYAYGCWCWRYVRHHLIKATHLTPCERVGHAEREEPVSIGCGRLSVAFQAAACKCMWIKVHQSMLEKWEGVRMVHPSHRPIQAPHLSQYSSGVDSGQGMIQGGSDLTTASAASLPSFASAIFPTARRGCEGGDPVSSSDWM